MSAREGPDLTLIIPGLFGPPPPAGAESEAALETLVEGLDLSALESLLSRAAAAPAAGPFESPEDLLFSAFGYPPPDEDGPAAAARRLADFGAVGEGEWWLRADPVHLKADMGGLVLFDGERFSLELDEAKALAETVAEQFAARGWRLELAHPLRWYLKLAAPARIHTTTLSMARLRGVDPHLPGGEEGRIWHGILNEAQMALHECAVNQDREARGEVAVNSLWFWGGGALPPAPPAAWSQVHGDSALLKGLAQHAGIECRPLEKDASAWLESAGPGRHLALMDQGHSAAQAKDVETWREFIAELSTTWFAPLLRALDDGRLRSVKVLTDRKLSYHAGRARWWWRLKARRAFSELAQV